MNAAIFESLGDPAAVLQLREQPVPQPEGGQVRVRMLASPINPSDLMFIRGDYTLKPRLPSGAGFEGVGIVEAAGGGPLPRLMLGKRVAVLNRRGGNWADYVVVPVQQLVPLKKHLSIEQAATFFVNPATAFIMTRLVLQIPEGQWLVQSAAGSELGKMVIRLGRRFGFRTLNIVRREAQIEELKQLGADRVIAFDASRQTPQQLAELIREQTNDSARYAIDSVGGAVGTGISQALSRAGRMLVFGTLSNEPIQLAPRDLMTPGATIEGFWLGNFMDTLNLFAKLRLVSTLSGLIADGTLCSAIGAKFALNDFAAAVHQAQQSGRNGKVLFVMNEAAKALSH